MCVLSIVLLFVFCFSNAQPGCQWGRSFPWRPFVALLAPLSALHNRNTLYFVFLILHRIMFANMILNEYKTYHLLNEQNINLIKPGAIILNASRGAVTKNSVLLNRISQKNDITLALDVWENEPNISTELLKLVNIATPHIAGYSLEGKVNGTYACYKNLCDFTGVSQLWQPDLPEIEEYQINVTELSTEEALSEIFNKIYNISSDDKSLRNYSGDIAVYFDNLRKTYPVRRESKGYDVKSDDEVIIKLMNYLAGI